MKATDLMIGDWVHSSFFGVPVRIKSINFKDGYGWVNTTLVPDTKSDASLSPIPLTPEILEKNGWRHHATYGSVEDETREDIYMLYQHSFEVVFDNKEAISIRHFVSEEDDGYDKLLIEFRDNGYKPMYVHTLQHALRLCGLEELADNIQI